MKNKLIGIYELITGIFGTVLVVFITLQKIFLKETQVLPSAFLGLILFLGVAFSGYGLIKEKKYGRKYSLWLQALQTISFTYNGIHLQTTLALVDYNIDRVSILFPFELKIYILPVILLLLLIKK